MEITEEHFVGKVAQKAVLVRSDGKVLITRDARDGDLWEIPGGRMNIGEQPAEALKRELFEELGIAVTIESILSISVMFHGLENSTMLLIAYEVSLTNEEEEFIVDPIEVTEMKWISAEELTQYKMYPDLQKVLEIYFANQA
jgi:mutator protein MutT